MTATTISVRIAPCRTSAAEETDGLQMDGTAIRLGIVAFVFVMCGSVNYFAVRMLDAPKSKRRKIGATFGAAGILLMTMVILWPLIAFLIVGADNASLLNRILGFLLCGYAFCTLGSILSLSPDSREK
ncbi:hypothetical protein LL974_02255 [Xanthomonas campestris pv. cannae]|nr:hypothetical protein [Xanthomonas campestris pv. cannae]